MRTRTSIIAAAVLASTLAPTSLAANGACDAGDLEVLTADGIEMQIEAPLEVLYEPGADVEDTSWFEFMLDFEAEAMTVTAELMWENMNDYDMVTLADERFGNGRGDNLTTGPGATAVIEGVPDCMLLHVDIDTWLAADPTDLSATLTITLSD